MTTEIPKRPYYDSGGTLDDFWHHEHCVARVAVEALRECDCTSDGWIADNCTKYGCPRCEALAKIEASGWKP